MSTGSTIVERKVFRTDIADQQQQLIHDCIGVNPVLIVCLVKDGITTVEIPGELKGEMALP